MRYLAMVLCTVALAGCGDASQEMTGPDRPAVSAAAVEDGLCLARAKNGAAIATCRRLSVERGIR